jgi:hypothetical protein
VLSMWCIRCMAWQTACHHSAHMLNPAAATTGDAPAAAAAAAKKCMRRCLQHDQGTASSQLQRERALLLTRWQCLLQDKAQLTAMMRRAQGENSRILLLLVQPYRCRVQFTTHKSRLETCLLAPAFTGVAGSSMAAIKSPGLLIHCNCTCCGLTAVVNCNWISRRVWQEGHWAGQQPMLHQQTCQTCSAHHA